MTDSPTQLALREWRRHLAHPQTLIVVAGVGVVLGLVGPFDTDDYLRLLPRVLYWVVMVLATYVTGYVVGALLDAPLKRLGQWPTVLLGGLGMGVAISAVVVTVNYATFAYVPDMQDLPQLVATVMAIALVVNVVLTLVLTPPPQDATEARAPAPILSRLPIEKRGALVALSVEDHYTRVFTTKGEDLLLMRLSDAIRETEGVSGAQVHRSHWAAFDHVLSARRTGDRAVLTMSTGLDVPVSRANVNKIKEAGLLPR